VLPIYWCGRQVLITKISPEVGVMNKTENPAQPTAWAAPRVTRLGAAQTADKNGSVEDFMTLGPAS